MERSLRQAITAAFASCGLPVGPVVSACFGMTGGMEAVPAVAASILPCQRLLVDHDAATALAGAGGGGPGVVVIAGGGAIAYGRNVAGRTARSSGWGYLAGDEGSGYDIGVRALRAACRADDGRGPPTVLGQLLLLRFAASDLWALRGAFYSGTHSRADLADVAQLVSEAATRGDVVALNILREAGEELALAALTVLARLDMTGTGATVYTAGGVFGAGPPLRGPFTAMIRARDPTARVAQPLFDQVMGALLLALQNAGITTGAQVMERMRATEHVAAQLKDS